MLHTLNPAWMEILIKKSVGHYYDTRFLVVAKDEDERAIYKHLRGQRDAWSIEISTIDEITYLISLWKSSHTEDIYQWDDILISHDLHDVFVKSWLGQHCKRKCC